MPEPLLLDVFGRVFGSLCRLLSCSAVPWFELSSSRLISITVAMSARRYTDNHQWISVNGTIGTIGISNFAQQTLGEMVFVDLPEVGKEFSQFDKCGNFETDAAAVEIFSPVSGKVTEINSAINEDPGLINTSCYEDGWLFKIKLKNLDELKALMDEAAYQSFTEG